MTKGEIEIRCKVNAYSTLVLEIKPVRDKKGDDKHYRYYYDAKVFLKHIYDSNMLFGTQKRTKIEALNSAVEFLNMFCASARNIVNDSSPIKAFISSTKKHAKGPNTRAVKEDLSSNGA